MNKLDIINRISYFRIKSNLSVRSLYQKIDMNDGYINRLESKKDFLPSLEVLLKIIEVCNISTEEFFYNNIEDYKLDITIINSLKETNPNKKKAIIEILQQ